MNTDSSSITDDPGQTSFWQASVLIPFLTVSLIWGGTWIVIKDQLGVVPESWSVTYRFALAALAMFVLAKARGQKLALGRAGHGWAMMLGLFQFACNFNFVYRAELYITSGLVAAMFALLIIPNALLGALFLKQRITGLFLGGSIIAIIGVSGLFAHEFARLQGAPDTLWLGIALTVLGVLSASIANIMQGTERMKAWPMLSMLAWAMFWGVVCNAVFALVSAGPPVFDMRLGYMAGIGFLALFASAVTFPLYFGLIRNIGPGRAAYVSTIVPVIAMIFSTIFEGYTWTPLAIGGGFLALAGLIIAMQARKPKTPRVVG